MRLQLALLAFVVSLPSVAAVAPTLDETAAKWVPLAVVIAQLIYAVTQRNLLLLVAGILGFYVVYGPGLAGFGEPTWLSLSIFSLIMPELSRVFGGKQAGK